MQTLKHIVVGTYVYEDDVDPLLGLSSELEEMRNRNVIETVIIKIMLHADPGYRRGDYFGRLDEVLTKPGWFSLKRVSLAIEIDLLRYNGQPAEVALRNLQFPRLSSCNSILFDFEVKNLYG